MKPIKFGAETEKAIFLAFLRKMKISPVDDVLDKVDFSKSIELYENKGMSDGFPNMSHVYFNMYFYEKTFYDLVTYNSVPVHKIVKRSIEIDKRTFECVEKLLNNPDQGTLWNPVPAHRCRMSDEFVHPSETELKKTIRNTIVEVEFSAISPMKSEDGRVFIFVSGHGKNIDMAGVH